MPEVVWLKDGITVAKHVTVTNSDKGSQLLIPTSERSDTGIYTITVKNLVGQESVNVEIRVTGECDHNSHYISYLLYDKCVYTNAFLVIYNDYLLKFSKM